MSYYKVIKGVRYDKSLLDTAEAYATDSPNKQITLDAIQSLYLRAEDGLRITETERRTLRYIQENYEFTDAAKAWIEEEEIPFTPIDTRVRGVLQAEFQMEHIQWIITEADVKQQEKLSTKYTFEQALKGAIQALAFTGWGYLGLTRFTNPERNVIELIDQGKLILYPMDYQAQADAGTLAFEIPKYPILYDIQEWWIWGLELPEIPYHRFVAMIRRNADFARGHSITFMSEQPENAAIADYITKEFLQYPHMKWDIDFKEAERQEKVFENMQGWAAALLIVLDGGVYNGESSISLRDQISLEEWYTSYYDVKSIIQSYLTAATITLVPEEYTQKYEAFLSQFNQLYFDSSWYFELQIPSKPDWVVLLNKNRMTNGIDDAWNDVYFVDEFPIETRLQKIIEEEFNVPGLQWHIDIPEAERQQNTYGPEWRTLKGVLRQTLNTILKDHQGSESPFSDVASVHEEFADPESFEDEAAYRAAVTEKVREYLNTGVLHLVSEDIFSLEEDELGDVYPPHGGEKLDTYWLFQLYLPDLSDHVYWIVIPRWPGFEEEGAQPYVYGFN